MVLAEGMKNADGEIVVGKKWDAQTNTFKAKGALLAYDAAGQRALEITWADTQYGNFYSGGDGFISTSPVGEHFKHDLFLHNDTTAPATRRPTAMKIT